MALVIAYTVDVIGSLAIGFLFDQTVNVSVKARKTFVELLREMKILDDRLVESLARNQQRYPGWIRRQQDAGDSSSS